MTTLFSLDEMKATLLLIAIVAAFVVASESAIINPGGGCRKCYRKDYEGNCKRIYPCSEKREFLKEFYELLQDMPRNNMDELEDHDY